MRGRTVAALMAVLPLSLLVACGPDDAPPPPPASTAPMTAPPTRPADPGELLDQAIEKTWDAPSKRLTGTVTIAAAGQTKTFDYIFVGNLAKGTQTDTAPQGSDVMEVVRIGDDVYIKAGEPFWQWYVPLEQRQYVVGRWVRASYDDYPSTVPASSTTVTPPAREVSRAGTDAVDGTPVTVLVDGKGNRYFVDEAGGPYLLRFEGEQATPVGPAAFRVEFSLIGEVRDVIAAPGGEIVDLHHPATESVRS